MRVIPDYGPLKESRSIILKFETESENTTDRALGETNNIDILDILSAEKEDLNNNKV